jgi:hypothetical protein
MVEVWGWAIEEAWTVYPRGLSTRKLGRAWRADDNLHGLDQIRFPKNQISSRFEEIRQVLEREGLLRQQ